MKKTQTILIGFGILGLLDSVLSFALPVDFTYVRFSIVWHFFLIGLLVFVRDKPLLTRLLIGAAGGLCSDLLITSTFPLNMFLYALLCVLAGLIPFFLSRTSRFIFWCVFLVLIGDALPFLVQKAWGMSDLPFFMWMLRIELLTLIFDALIAIGLLYTDLVMTRYFLFQSRRRRQAQGRSIAPHVRTANRNHPGLNRSSTRR